MKIFRCLLCSDFSLSVICKSCKQKLLKPEIEFKDEVLSFYSYDDIEMLLKYKYHKFGNLIFKELAKPLKEFSRNFKEEYYLIPVDDNPKKGFSHTAILANALKSKYLKPLYGSLRAKNSVKYAGKSLEFRLNNPKDFEYFGKRSIRAILIDDIYTTGTTLNEAKEVLNRFDVKVDFSIVLAKVRR